MAGANRYRTMNVTVGVLSTTKHRVITNVAHGAAGRAAFGSNDFRRGPVNVAVITLKQ